MRDLHNSTIAGSEHITLPQISFFPLLVKEGKGKRLGVREKQQAIIYPHDWISALSQNKVLFKKILVGSRDLLHKYWESERARPDDWKHPRVIAGDTDMCIPLAMHGDDANCWENDDVQVVSIHSVVTGIQPPTPPTTPFSNTLKCRSR